MKVFYAGEFIDIEIPEGWERVTSGEAQAEDRMFIPEIKSWCPIHHIKFDLSHYICVIRKVKPMSIVNVTKVKKVVTKIIAEPEIILKLNAEQAAYLLVLLGNASSPTSNCYQLYDNLSNKLNIKWDKNIDKPTLENVTKVTELILKNFNC